jgi:predicted sulfurtransferase
LETSKKNLEEQVAKYQKLLKEYDVKINESIQFQQLKKLLQDKNTLIIDLKNKIKIFEEGNNI